MVKSAVNFSILADIPSGLLAFFVSKDLSRAQISSTVHSRSGEDSCLVVRVVVIVRG